jgi:glycosyltransferase involved in cell wall biosynthesis
MARPARKIHIVHIITDLYTGGAEVMLARLLASLDRDQFEPGVIALTGWGPVGDALKAQGVPVRCLGLPPGRVTPAAFFKLAGWLRELCPDVIHTWMYHSDLVGGLAARLAGSSPVVWGIHNSTLDPQYSRRSTLAVVWLLARLSYQLPARIFSCSQVARDVHVGRGYCAGKFQIIPNGFDLSQFHPDPQARRSVRTELGIPEGTPVVGLAARFDPQKDHHNFVLAAGRLAKREPDVHFVLCGDRVTWDNPELSGWIDAAGLREIFHLLGRRADMPAVMAALDVGATASAYGEAFPQVVGEAMACEVPCVVTDVGDSGFLVGDTGRVVPARDPDALAAAMKDLLTLPAEDRQRLGKAARQRVQENFSLGEICEQYSRVYRELASSKGVHFEAERT